MRVVFTDGDDTFTLTQTDMDEAKRYWVPMLAGNTVETPNGNMTFVYSVLGNGLVTSHDVRKPNPAKVIQAWIEE